MANSRASGTPVPGKKRKLDNVDSVTPKRLRHEQTPKSKTSSTKTSRIGPTPTSATPNTTFMTAQDDVPDDQYDTLQSQSSQVESPLRHLQPSKSQHVVPRPSPMTVLPADDGHAESDSQSEKQRIKRAGKRARRRSEKGSKAEPKKAEKKHKSASGGAVAAKDTAMEIEVDQSRLSWLLESASAGLYLGQDPIFLANNSGDEFLVAAQQHELQLLSLETSLPERTQQAPSGLKIQSVVPSRHGNSVIVALDDNSVAEWDPRTGELGERTKLGNSKKSKLLALAVGSDEESKTKDEYFSIMETKGSPAIQLNRETVFNSDQPLTSISIFGNGEYVVAVGHNVLVLGQRRGTTPSGDQAPFVWVAVPTKQTFTCFAARILQAQGAAKRSSLALALGHTNGQIHLYDDVSTLFNQSRPQLQSPRILHWHRETVCAVKFSRDGNYLISGGKETVLTIWQLATGNKQFLPHLTSTIEGIAVNGRGDRYALRMGDNSIMVLSTSELKPIANFAGLQMSASSVSTASDELDPPKQAAALHPRNQNQLLLTVPATRPKAIENTQARPFLQTFDIRDSCHVARQALTRNNVTDQNTGPRQQPILPPDVIHLSVSADGQWLATVDEWMPSIIDMNTFTSGDSAKTEEERLRRREVYLKFWKWDEAESIWTLATRADAPHSRHVRDIAGAGEVFGITSDPHATGFATIGEDGCVRIWRPKTRVRDGVSMTAGDGAEIVEWTCRRTVHLPRDVERADSPMDDEKELPAPTHACLAFSNDGSMLVAAQALDNEAEAPLIHFINVSSGERITKSTIAPSDLIDLAFVDRYLVALGRKTAHVWDIVEDQLNSRITFPHEDMPRMAVDEASGTFAVAKPGRVSVFNAGQAQPLQELDMEEPIAAILSSTRGYVLLFDDCTIRQLSPAAKIERHALADVGAGAEIIEDEAIQEDGPDLFGNATEAVATSQDVDMGDVEDDRPVVRPEQLAEIFESGASYAMQPVQEMFEAVVGLYARKPYARAGGTTES